MCSSQPSFYKFRFTLHRIAPGFIRLDSLSCGFMLKGGMGLEFYPRDADTLENATRYHIESGGFPTEDDARTAGEYVRSRLRLLNSVLDLGLTIHTTEEVTTRASDDMKAKVAQQSGATLLDAKLGLSVIPDDGLHAEILVSGNVNVAPDEPTFLIDALDTLWDKPLKYDKQVEDAVRLLNLSSAETSDSLKFLFAYLALEQLIPMEERSEASKKLIRSFIRDVNEADIAPKERESLTGALSNLVHSSFAGSLRSYAKRIEKPQTIRGFKPTVLASEAISLRNSFAHGGIDKVSPSYREITLGLRDIAHAILWEKLGLPRLSFERPADNLRTTKFEIRIC